MPNNSPAAKFTKQKTQKSENQKRVKIFIHEETTTKPKAILVTPLSKKSVTTNIKILLFP